MSTPSLIFSEVIETWTSGPTLWNERLNPALVRSEEALFAIGGEWDS